MRPAKIKVELSVEERDRLEQMLRCGVSSAREQARARILLLTDHSQGRHHTDDQVAAAVMVTSQTILRVRKRYQAGGLDAALYDKPRPGGKPKVTGDIAAKLVMLACSEPPDGRTRWTLRLLADQMVALNYVDSLSNVAVYQRLKKRT